MTSQEFKEKATSLRDSIALLKGRRSALITATVPGKYSNEHLQSC